MINVDICSVIQVCFCLRSWGGYWSKEYYSSWNFG